MKVPVARCFRCGRVFELTKTTGCPDGCGQRALERAWYGKEKYEGAWKHEGWFEEGVMIVWGDR